MKYRSPVAEMPQRFAQLIANSTVVERAYYERSTDRAGPFKFKRCTVAWPLYGKKTGTFFFITTVIARHYNLSKTWELDKL